MQPAPIGSASNFSALGDINQYTARSCCLDPMSRASELADLDYVKANFISLLISLILSILKVVGKRDGRNSIRLLTGFLLLLS